MTSRNSMTSADAFAELGRTRFHETTFDHVVARICGLARRTIARATDVSVTLVGPGGAHTAASTGALAVALDQWQYEHGHGPGLAAAAASITISVTDVAADTRWPDWTDHAIDAGAHSALSIGLPVHEWVTGALNVYSTEPRAFDDHAVALAETFAGCAATAMADTHHYAGGADLARHMRDAMDSRATIEQAKGIIMADRHCTAVEASAVLAKLSQYSGSTIAAIAAAIVDQTAGDRDAGRSGPDVVPPQRRGVAGGDRTPAGSGSPPTAGHGSSGHLIIPAPRATDAAGGRRRLRHPHTASAGRPAEEPSRQPAEGTRSASDARQSPPG
ncbi:GAF and ANTAR domain-containing protein [Actinoplanes sp. NPDC026623]|uniref:GAF domain-containing protein n=1 Tax=Actinoplanes sp. NPDC026623 TaxID=3155610 RepID=UPI0033E2842D